MALKIRGLRRKRVTKLQKLIASIEKDDAKPAPLNPTTPKILVFDPAVAGLADAVTNVKARCTDLLADA